jgi:hypothetical protein
MFIYIIKSLSGFDNKEMIDGNIANIWVCFRKIKICADVKSSNFIILVILFHNERV